MSNSWHFTTMTETQERPHDRPHNRQHDQLHGRPHDWPHDQPHGPKQSYVPFGLIRAALQHYKEAVRLGPMCAIYHNNRWVPLFRTFGENNYKRIISFPIAQCCMPYPPWAAARGHGRSKISHTAWGGQWQWQWQWQWQMIGCPARIGSSLGATWSGSIDAWARGRGERSLFSLVDWL